MVVTTTLLSSLARLCRLELELQTINRRSCTIMEKSPSRTFSWLKGLLALSHLSHYAKWAFTHGK